MARENEALGDLGDMDNIVFLPLTKSLFLKYNYNLIDDFCWTYHHEIDFPISFTISDTGTTFISFSAILIEPIFTLMNKDALH